MRILIDNGNTPAAPRPYIGHYGRLRKAYLEQYRPDLYTALVANEKLHEHCAEIDEAARSRIDLISCPRLWHCPILRCRVPLGVGSSCV